MRKKLLFVALVALFTLFGGGRIGDWFILCADQDGWIYEVDNQSVELLPGGEVSLRVKAGKGSHVRVASWLIDPGKNTLRVDSEAPMNIAPGSVASRVLVYLREEGVLKPTSLRVSRELKP